MNKQWPVGLAAWIIAHSACAAPPLADRLRAASAPARLALPAANELAAARKLFDKLLAGKPDDEIRADAAPLELVWEALDGANGEIWLLAEKAGARRGRGLLAIRRGGQNHLQMPHSFSDEMTREIGLSLFLEGHFEAALWNTVPRRYDYEGDTVHADMAHLDGTYFNAFTAAWAAARPGKTLLQIHGFEESKRRSRSAANAAIILSSGERSPPDRLRRLRDCLANAGLGPIGLFGDTVSELGATTNAQARIVRLTGAPRESPFVHMEIDRDLRRALRDEPDPRRRLLACVQERPR